MQLVVVERLIVADDDQQRDLVVDARPHRLTAHEEIAVAKDGDREATGVLERQRGANRQTGTGADAAAAVRTDVIERMTKVPALGVVGERHLQQGNRLVADDVTQRREGLVDGDRTRDQRWIDRVRPLAAGEFRRLALQRARHGGRGDVGVRRQQQIDGRQRHVIHAPAIVDDVIERHLNDLGLRFLRPERGLEGAAKIHPVEAEDHIGFLDRLKRVLRSARPVGADMQPVVRREGGAHFRVGDHARAQFFRERHAVGPGRIATRHASHHDKRPLGGEQHVERGLDLAGVDAVGHRRHVARGLDRRQLLGLALFLQFHVEHDIGRPLGRGIGDPAGAQDGFARGAHRAWLIVPLHVMANHGRLIARGVDPLDPWAALLRVDGTGRADNDDGGAIAPRVEDRHGGVHQADVGMNGGGHRLAGHFRIALRDGDGVLLVQTQQHPRILVAEIIDDAVVQAAIARAGIERDIGHIERAKRLGHHIAAKDRALARGPARGLNAWRQWRNFP